ncbi:RNA polymerase sigma factor [Vibrio alginolyticus]|nr:sigma-70 family RNA polymerase sigma factor [Vibrio parahaemolyticus]EJE8516506.1 sigma-70 family RNA polymerase sigma factor [Vibrio parahaemolyticus]EJE8775301.1 sigma-70 family RNA polymerase sigma factor [Vibrio parahaemolyticus]MBM4891714.1 sigma-70 family RNA polymerase sigma factor [Vibrio parahaemolyticus]WMP11145.1 sigma-70 family RNA polymerase sigma factor [Vibrio parahaemolyticus]
MSTDKHQIGLLLSKIALRDRDAFEALYELTSARLFTLICNIVKDEQIAADILQEGFVKLWYSEQQSVLDYPWAWLCQTMRNLAIDEVRKRNRYRDEYAKNVMEEVCEPADVHLNMGLDHCLKSLCEEKRNAIVLAYQHGMSHQEIVQHVKTPLGTVKSWIRRGLQELKRCLTQ